MNTTRRDFLVGVGALAGACVGGLYRVSRGDGTSASLIRPPGALPEREFLAACIRCGQCVQACPTDPDTKPHPTLIMGTTDHGSASGTPYVNTRAVPCDLCAGYDELRCIAACPTSALNPVAEIVDIRMGLAVIDESICLAYNDTLCKTCWHVCPFPYEAIRFDQRLRPIVDDSECIGCGLCDHACPTEPSSIPIRPITVTRTTTATNEESR